MEKEVQYWPPNCSVAEVYVTHTVLKWYNYLKRVFKWDYSI